MSKKIIVPIIMGSDSDFKYAEKMGGVLDRFGVPFNYSVASGHKTTDHLLKVIAKYDAENDIVVYETLAGMSNALTGVVVGNTPNPVIACPPYKDLKESPEMLIDMWSTVRMPSNVPAMTVLGARNGALAAVSILSLYDTDLRKKYIEHRKEVKDKILEADKNRHVE
jgi:phosphoribosylaminoimidazole carboxylase PurE protein